MKIPTEKQLCAVGIAVTVAMYLHWAFVQLHGMPIAYRLFALVPLALFDALCVRFVSRWYAFWRGGADDLPVGESPPYIEVRIFCATLIWSALIIVVTWLLFKPLHGEWVDRYLPGLSFFGEILDTPHYLYIAENWYPAAGDPHRVKVLAFPPGFPILIRIAALIFGNYLHAALAVSSLAFAAAATALYRLCRLDLPHDAALRAVVIFCAIPGAFFFAAPMSDGLFVLCSALCLYCARTRRWLAGCLFAALAAYTRVLGVTLFVPLVFEAARLYANERDWRLLVGRAVGSMLCLGGLGLYLFTNWSVSGDAFKFLEYQRVFWYHVSVYFFSAIAYILVSTVKWAWSSTPEPALGLGIPNIIACLAAPALMFAAARRLRASYTAWFIAYYWCSVSVTNLISAPRYMIGCFPVIVAITLLTDTKRAKTLWIDAAALLGIPYFLAFVMRWQVW